MTTLTIESLNEHRDAFVTVVTDSARGVAFSGSLDFVGELASEPGGIVLGLRDPRTGESTALLASDVETIAPART